MFLAVMFVLGAVFGSFACCQAWRMRYKEEGKEELGKWSVCMSCGKRLEWYENLPVLSWVFLRGRCRKCGAKIGAAEILSELGLGIAFVLVGNYFGCNSVMAVVEMLLILVMLVLMWIVLVYDAKWGRMPTSVLVATNICAVIYVVMKVVSGEQEVDFWNIFYSVGILAGIYYLLYFFSHEKWVGGGDWILALAIALVLGNWFLALVVLFLANFLASIMGIFAVYKHGRKVRIPLGPFLVVAFIVTFAMQELIVGLGVESLMNLA